MWPGLNREFPLLSVLLPASLLAARLRRGSKGRPALRRRYFSESLRHVLARPFHRCLDSTSVIECLVASVDLSPVVPSPGEGVRVRAFMS